MDLNILGIITWIISALNILLGIWVLIRNYRNPNNIAYAFVVLAISVWTISTYFYNNPEFLSPEMWLKIVYVASYLMLISQCVFVYFFPKRLKDDFTKYFTVILLTAVPSIYVLFFLDNVVLSVTHYPEDFLSIAQMGKGYMLYMLPNALGIVLLSTYFAFKSKNFAGFEKAQIKFYTIGALVMIIPIVFIDYIVPLIWNNTKLYIYGPVFVIPFTTSVAYSIITKRFLDLRNILSGVLTFVGKALFLSGLFYLFYTIMVNIFQSVYQKDAVLFSLFVAPLVTLVFLKYSQALDLLSKKLILKKKISASEVIQEFSKQNSTVLNLDKISINVKLAIRSALGIRKVGILLLDTKNSKILYKYLADFDLNNGTRDLLEILHYWDSLGDDPILIADEVKRENVFGYGADKRLNRILSFLDKYSMAAVLPLNRQTQLNGILLLGYKEQEAPLTVEEFDFLETLIANTSVAMGRALLYKEVEDFNKSLKEKVNEQTQELQVKVKELEEARKKENDMIDIMGHELRTPATIVKLNVELLENFINKIPEDRESFTKYIFRIKEAVENEIDLINTLLSSAKLEGDKIEINPEKVDIYAEIDMAVHGEESNAQKKGLTIINNVSQNISNVYADKARTIEILNNLVSNAVKYTEKGAVTISAQDENNFVRISVADTGRGISQEDIQKLGTKFFRTKIYTSTDYSDDFDIVRPGGTGLGLYVTFNLVRKMGGEITVQSEIGKGSIFSFTLPKYGIQETNVETVNVKSNNMFERLGLTK